MATATYESLIPPIAVHAVNCPEPVLIDALRNACIEFCSETLLLTEAIDPISVVADEAVYSVDVGAGVEVVKLLHPLYFLGRKLERGSTLGIESYTDWQSHTAREPHAYTCFSPNEITLYPKPTVSADAALTGRCAIAPTRTSTTVEASLLTDYRTELIAGTLAAVLLVPDQPYSNAQMALHYKKLFDAAKANAATLVRSAFMNAPLRVRFPGF